ncbi:MAG: hypothetical protein QXR45_09085 [Candidatus Bathyarchaeia archaeon]
MKASELKIQYKRGLTLRSLLIVAIGTFFLTPITTYSMLVGAGNISAVTWIIVLLFTEIYGFTRRPLSAQEVTVIWYGVGAGATSSLFLNLLQQGYIATSPFIGMFIDPYTGKSLRDLIPVWYAPPYYSRAYLLRTFFDKDWTIPTLVAVSFSVLALIMQISLAIIFSQMYVEFERLPFPFAPIEASICKTLGEREETKMRILILSALFGCFWGYLLYGVPIITREVYKVPVQIIPIPYVDLNNYMEQLLPGASFGIATDIAAYTWGFFLPANIVICMFAGSFATWFIGNHLALSIPYFSEWRREWSPGMSISLIYQRSTLWVWINPQIGAAIASGIVPLIIYRKTIIHSFKNLLSISSSSSLTIYSSLRLLLLYIASGCGILALFHCFLPKFPIWLVAPLVLGYPFFIAMIAGRMVGEVGFPISIPYVWQGAVLASNYYGVEPWFFNPLPASGDLAAINVYQVKVCQLTETRFLDLFKVLAFVFPLSVIGSLVYVSLFWWISPIPSAAYPATTISWPIAAMNTGLWATRQLNIFKPELLMGSAIFMTVLSLVFQYLKVPFSLTGTVIGLYTLPPYSLAWLIGFIIGRFIFKRKLKERWEEIKPILVGGLNLGSGVAIGLSVTIAIIAKSLWILPY